MTLDVAGDGLLNVMVSAGAVNALVQNGGMIRADGGEAADHDAKGDRDDDDEDEGVATRRLRAALRLRDEVVAITRLCHPA